MNPTPIEPLHVVTTTVLLPTLIAGIAHSKPCSPLGYTENAQKDVCVPPTVTEFVVSKFTPLIVK